MSEELPHGTSAHRLQCLIQCHMCRVGQNRIYTPYLTVYMVNSLPKIPYTHRMYIYTVCIYIYIYIYIYMYGLANSTCKERQAFLVQP